MPGAGLITAHDAGVKPSVRRVVAVRCGVRQAVWEFEGDARRRLVVEADATWSMVPDNPRVPVRYPISSRRPTGVYPLPDHRGAPERTG